MPGELIENMSDWGDFANFPNLITGDWFWTGILLVMFFIVYFALINNKKTVKESVIASLFLTTIVALIASFIPLINFNIFIYLLTVLSFSTIAFFKA